MQIFLEDNQYKPKFGRIIPKNSWDEKYRCPLNEISGKSLQELRKKDNFLVFPSKDAESDLDKNDNFIYRLSGKENEPPSFQTTNIMGFLGFGKNLQMQIISRFDQHDDSEQSCKNFFLHYMLQKVCNVAFAPQASSAEDDFFEFLYYLFPSYLRKACAQGIFRAYVTREYNDANVRGPIDVSRHIRYNTPFNGKIAYHTREYTTDNKVTQLIRHTIEYIRSLSVGSSILEADIDTRNDVNAVVAATTTYSRNARMQVIAKNLHPVTHPYYTEYEELRKICIAILQHKKLSYGDSDKPITGILFDGAALWEEYLARVFEEHKLGLIHSNNRTGGNGISLLDEGRKNHYPDFYLEKPNAVVLDAKYKKLCTRNNDDDIDKEDCDLGDEKNSIDDNYRIYPPGRDVMQMLAYMHALEAKKSVLISPYALDVANIDEKSILEKLWHTMGYNSSISVIGVPIPTGTLENVDGKKDWNQYKEYMDQIETMLVEKIKSRL
ncbi:restriction endonuclease [Candidatus Saccharibacteria bacterium]|nr:restriction endonuclease [Candidatus Saccharibacteria bacterium]